MYAAMFAGLAQALSASGAGPYFPAVARWAGAPLLDDGASVITPGAPVALECQAQGDRATESMRQAEGFVEADIAILVIGLDNLDTEARLVISSGPHAGTYAIQSVERDPVGIGWLCRGRGI